MKVKSVLCITTIVISAIFLFMVVLFFSGSYVGRYVFWNFADVNDLNKFDCVTISPSSNPYQFVKKYDRNQLSLPDKFSEKGMQGLNDFLDQKATTAFLVIQNDTILFEYYADGYDATTIIPSFSVTKSIVSALAGIAIDMGYIQDKNQFLTDYIPELLEKDARFGDITIDHLLNMRSGIRFNEGYKNPFGHAARFYYGTNLPKYLMKLDIKQQPGQQYDYISANPQFIALIIERATGMKISEFAEKYFWKKIGTEYQATWNIDSKRSNCVKAFCCFNATPHDFAKFGKLYLDKGKWNGEQVVSESWIDYSTTVVNDSKDSQGYSYTNHWRVLDHAIFAKGILGQYIYVDYEKNLVMLRFGESYSGVDWAEFFGELSKQL